MAKNPPDSLATLSVGNIVTAATSLYKSNFKRYFQVSLRSTKWILAILFSALGMTIVGAIIYGVTKSWLFVFLTTLAWSVFTLYCLAKYLTNRAIISRLVYQELIDSPETVTDATKKLAPLNWKFLRLSLWIVICLFIIIFLTGILFFFTVGMMGIIIPKQYLANRDILVSLIITIIVLGLFAIWILTIVRYYSYWFVAELALAIESNISAKRSMKRSKELSIASTGRVQLVILIAIVITLPLTLFSSTVSTIGQLLSSNFFNSVSNSNRALGGGLIFLGFVMSIVTELFIVPFWQAIKAVIYYDLKNSREGRDLVL
jgi:MFS family permease